VLPWLCLVVVAVGLAVAAWVCRAKPRAWADMGTVCDEV
jgi:hypothetical protein